ARVATRRLRAALPRVGAGGKAQKLAKSVRRLTQALGPTRELDVALLILDELEERGEVPRGAIERLRASIADERHRLQDHVREEIDEFDLEKVRKRAVAAARKSADAKHPKDVKRVEVARERTARRARRLAA